MIVGILEADPTRIGGIQRFVCSLAEYLPQGNVDLLAYYADLSHEKFVKKNIISLNDRKNSSLIMNLIGSKKGEYLANSPFRRNIALLRDIFRIRHNLAKRFPGGDTLVLNSASALLLFCSLNVLKNNRIILVQHTNPQTMLKRSFYFGGFFKKYKIHLFKKYVDDFVMLSPFEKEDFDKWLPLDTKKCHVIRHAVEFPKDLPNEFPQSVAVLARLATEKRIDRVIKCAKLLPDVNFNIYGTGPEQENLQNAAKEVANVYFRGYTNNITQVFEKNSILLITSDYEGYPISGIESCIHGRPIIALNTFSAAPDLIINNTNGILIDAYTPEKVVNAIKTIFADPEKYKKGAVEHREHYNCKIAEKKWNSLLFEKE